MVTIADKEVYKLVGKILGQRKTCIGKMESQNHARTLWHGFMLKRVAVSRKRTMMRPLHHSLWTD